MLWPKVTKPIWPFSLKIKEPRELIQKRLSSSKPSEKYHTFETIRWLNQKYAFPIIGIGPMKPEDYPNKKPEGSVVQERQIGTVSQELFDVLLIDQKGLRFIRYGAGEDRYIPIG